VLGGLITVTASVVFVGVAITAQGTGGTMSLGFKTLPMVFAQMPGGNFFGASFFLILFLAAITSSLSMLQPTKAFFEEALGVTRGVSTTMVTLWGLAGNAFVIWYSKDLTALDTIDFWVGSFFILVVAAVQIIAFGWIFGLDKGLAEAHEGAALRIPRLFGFVIQYVSPAYLLVVIVGFCIYKAPGYVDTLRGNVTTVVAPDDAASRRIRSDFPADTRLAYAWKQVGGTRVELAEPTAEKTSFPYREPDDARNFEVNFELTVADAGNQKIYPVNVKVDVESPGNARMTWCFLLVTIVLLVLITFVGARRWRAQGLDLDGQRPAAD